MKPPILSHVGALSKTAIAPIETIRMQVMGGKVSYPGLEVGLHAVIKRPHCPLHALHLCPTVSGHAAFLGIPAAWSALGN